MSIIDRVTSHYDNQEKLVISVPEWGEGDVPLNIHVHPMTMAELNAMQRAGNKNASNVEQAANIIVIKARDSEGNRLFKLEDREALMERADYRVIARIAEEIEEKYFSDVETQMGNSEETPSDETS